MMVTIKMRMGAVALGVLALTILLSVAVQSDALAEGRRLALLIGVNSYPNLDEERQLKTAVNDASAVAAALTRYDFATTVLRDLDRASFVAAVNKFSREIRPGDEVLFFFAGHGVNFGGVNLMLPSDIPQAQEVSLNEEARLQELAVREKFIVQTIVGAGARVVIVIIDACRDNPLNVDGDRTRSTGSRKGLSVVPDKTDGVFMIYSASTGQLAFDSLPGESPSANLTSVFTRVLVDQIGVEGQSLNQIARATRSGVEQLVKASTGFNQRPSAYDELNNEYYFSEPKTVEAGTDALLREWEIVKKTDDEAVIRAFMVKHSGDALYRSLAEAALRKKTSALASNARLREASDVGGQCDRLAAQDGNPDNPDRILPVHYDHINGKMAMEVCEKAIQANPGNNRYRLQFARAANKLKLFDLAKQQMQILIGAGYPAAYRELGDNYQYGDGYEQDYAKAIDAYNTGVAKGDGGCASALTGIYRNGRGVGINYERAREFAELGYRRGAAQAAFSLGAMLREGQGAKKDFERARTILSEAIERGSVQGHFSLAALQDEGKGGPRDPVSAGASLFRALELRGFENIVDRIADYASGPDAWSKEAVSELQLRLSEEGYYQGEIDGIIGKETVAAAKKYYER